jgi:hypothetical protein
MNASVNFSSMAQDTFSSVDYARIEAAIGSILAARAAPPSLEVLAKRAGLSSFHF